MGEVGSEPDEALGAMLASGRRLLVLLAAIYVGTLLGALRVDRLDSWDVDPVVGFAALVTIMAGSPVAIVLAAAKLSRVASGLLAVTVGVLFTVTVLEFGHSESSTASLVFTLWWIPGIPIAAAITWASHRLGR